MNRMYTPQELEITLGQNIKTLRLQQNTDRRTLSLQAGVSENALRHLENGTGVTLKTLIRVLKALGRESWLMSLAPKTSVNPLHIVRSKQHRQRARRKHDKKE